MSTEQNYSGEQVFTNTFEPTATPSTQTAQTKAQSPIYADERRTGELSKRPPKEFDLQFRALDFAVGDQAHQLFFALLAQLRAHVQDTIVDFDPNDLPTHIERWDEMEDLLDLLTGLFTKTNWYASDLADHVRDSQHPDWRKSARETLADKTNFWFEKSKYHPALESKEGKADE